MNLRSPALAALLISVFAAGAEARVVKLRIERCHFSLIRFFLKFGADRIAGESTSH